MGTMHVYVTCDAQAFEHGEASISMLCVGTLRVEDVGTVKSMLRLPVGEPRPVREFFAAIKRRDFIEAESLGKDLLERYPRHPRVRKRLAGVLDRLGKGDEAHAIVADGMDTDLSSAIEAAMRAIYESFDVPSAHAAGWRYMTRGMSAVCAIEHADTSITGFRLLTKVVDPRSRSVAREIDFYTRVMRSSDTLVALSPRLVDYRPIPGTHYAMLTLEFIEGRRPGVGDSAAVRDAWIALARGSEDLGLPGSAMRRSGLRDGLRRRAIGRLRHRLLYPETFTWLHAPRVGLEMFDLISRRLRRTRGADDALGAAERLRRWWIERSLHAEIDPRRHYGLIHGDFHEANLIVDEATGSCRVIDWETVSWGPPGLDMTAFTAGLAGFEFEHLEDIVLKHMIGNERMPSTLHNDVAPVLLVVMVLVGWLGRRPVEWLNESHGRTVQPALDWVLAWRRT